MVLKEKERDNHKSTANQQVYAKTELVIIMQQHFTKQMYLEEKYLENAFSFCQNKQDKLSLQTVLSDSYWDDQLII